MCVTIIVTKSKVMNSKGGVMGIMVSKDLEEKSELNRRITSDLRTRTQQSIDRDNDDSSDYETETRKTGRFTWVWIVLIVLAIISLICILFI